MGLKVVARVELCLAKALLALAVQRRQAERYVVAHLHFDVVLRTLAHVGQPLLVAQLVAHVAHIGRVGLCGDQFEKGRIVERPQQLAVFVHHALAVVERPRIVLCVERTPHDKLGGQAYRCLVSIHAVIIRIQALIVHEHRETCF